jgi:hypothetical protein
MKEVQATREASIKREHQAIQNKSFRHFFFGVILLPGSRSGSSRSNSMQIHADPYRIDTTAVCKPVLGIRDILVRIWIP